MHDGGSGRGKEKRKKKKNGGNRIVVKLRRKQRFLGGITRCSTARRLTFPRNCASRNNEVNKKNSYIPDEKRRKQVRFLRLMETRSSPG